MGPDKADDLLRAALLAERVRWPDRAAGDRPAHPSDASPEPQDDRRDDAEAAPEREQTSHTSP